MTVFGEQAFSHAGPAELYRVICQLPSRPQQTLHPSAVC